MEWGSSAWSAFPPGGRARGPGGDRRVVTKGSCRKPGGAPRTPPAWLRVAFRLPRHLYAHDLGWVLGRRFLQLTHTGRVTGRRHATVLEVVGTTPADELVVVSGFGARADWLRNLRAGGPAELTLGRRTSPARHRLLEADEAVAVLAAYERRNRLVGPVMRRLLSRLAGWRYRGTDADRRRLVEQLPLVALAPRTG